ncbi:MAG: outer membrane protein assembly factor BamD [Longimicrobiales bacterium]
MLRRAALPFLCALVFQGCGSTQPYQGMTVDQVYAIGVQAYEAGEYDEAIRALDRLFLSFAGFEQAANARLLLGHAHFAKEDFLSAQAEYTRFLDRHPVHPEAPLAALGICRSLAELSPIPQRDQTYTEDARSTCRNVVLDYQGTPEAAEAAELAEAMRLKLAEKEFLNAQFYFSRELYDSAITYFGFVVEGYPDTAWAPRALLGIYRSNLAIGYDDLAEDARDELLRRYPDSPAAREVNVDGNGGG